MIAIVTTEAASRGWNTPDGIRFIADPACASTNENSPTCASAIPLRAAAAAGKPSRIARDEPITVLPTRIPTVASATFPGSVVRTWRSSIIPIDMKKTLLKMSRKGRMSASACMP